MPATQTPKASSRRDILPHGHWPAAGDVLANADLIRVRCICNWQSSPIHENEGQASFRQHIREVRRAHY